MAVKRLSTHGHGGMKAGGRDEKRMGNGREHLRRPRLLSAALIAALLIVPALLGVEQLTARPGGDGLGGFFPAALTYLLGALLSWGLAVAGWLRGERPRWLVPLAVAATGVPLLWLAR